MVPLQAQGKITFCTLILFCPCYGSFPCHRHQVNKVYRNMLKHNPDLPQHAEKCSPVSQYLQFPFFPSLWSRFLGAAAAASSCQSLRLLLTQVGTKPIHMSLLTLCPIFHTAQSLSSPWLRQALPDNQQCSQSAPERSP